MMPVLFLLNTSSALPQQSTQIDPAALLNDYALPAHVSQMPAVGWWLVLVIVIALSVITFIIIKRHYQKRQARNQAIKLALAAKTPAELNRILKQAALSYLPRTTVASLNQAHWLTLQLQLVPKHTTALKPALTDLQQNLYKAEPVLANDTKQAAVTWLKHAFPIKKSSLTTQQEGNHHV